MYRTVISAAMLAGVSAGVSAAQTQDTLRAALANGLRLTLGRQVITIDYHEDGTYSARQAGMNAEGYWRIEGDSLCVRSELSLIETCTKYPEGQRPGDTFEVTSPALGLVKVTIRK